VIDGGINGDRLRASQPTRVAEKGETGLLGIDAIAETHWQIHRQHPSAWTQEIDLRASVEVFGVRLSGRSGTEAKLHERSPRIDVSAEPEALEATIAPRL
jgi:hypothetical protein